MISMCIVTLPEIEKYLTLSLNTVLKKRKLVNEILVCDVSKDSSYRHEETREGVTIKWFGVNLPELDCNDLFDQSSQHALALHEIMSCATNNYILLSDPDTLWFCAVDQMYFDLMSKFDLHLVGCCKVNAVDWEAPGHFPNPFSMMFKKQNMPGLDYMPEHTLLRNGTKVPGKYLIPPLKYLDGKLDWFNGKPKYDMSMYAKKDGFCDTGAMLVPWAHQQGWRWLSFLTDDGRTYTNRWHRASVRVPYKEKPHDILYHSISSVNQGRVDPGKFHAFEQKYKVICGANNEQQP